MDAKFVKGMLNNPDIQPNATINHWIAAILLFDFKLTHIPADKHHGPDGLSRRAPAKGEDEGDDSEDWIDWALSLGLWVSSWINAPHHCGIFALALFLSDNALASEDPVEFPVLDKACKVEEHLVSRTDSACLVLTEYHIKDTKPCYLI